MNQPKHSEHLQALQRWQSSELDDAKMRMNELNAAAADKLIAVENIQTKISNLHEMAREQALGQTALDPQALLRMSAFGNLQQHELQTAQNSHREAVRRADDARLDVQHLFEKLSVTERLLDRREHVVSKEQQRLFQKQLDEGALTRAPQKITHTENDTHGS